MMTNVHRPWPMVSHGHMIIIFMSITIVRKNLPESAQCKMVQNMKMTLSIMLLYFDEILTTWRKFIFRYRKLISIIYQQIQPASVFFLL